MNGLPYYKAYPRDFIEGTIGMPFEIKCAYRVVLDIIYMQGGKLPDDARYISGVLGCSIRKWKSIRQSLLDLDKLHVCGEFLTNYRAGKEVETLSKLQEVQRENRSIPNKNNGLQSPRSDQSEPDTDTERKKEPTATAAGTDFQKGLTGKNWIWSEGVEHIIRTSDCNQHQARSKIGYLLKMCDEKPDRLMKFFIEALEQGSANPEALIKTQAGKMLSAPAGAEHVQVVAIPSHDERYKRLQDRHLKENGKRKFQANGVAHFPKDWVDGLSDVSGNA